MGASKSLVAQRGGMDIGDPNAAVVPVHLGKEIQRRAAYGAVNVESLTKYLEALRECGVFHRAALAANLSYSSVLKQRQNDPEFAAEESMAKELWIYEKIDEPFYEIGIKGQHRKIINPKTGTLHDGEKVYSPQIALAYARKFDPNYRDKQEVDHRVSGGVVIVTNPGLTDVDLDKYAREMEAEKRGEMIEGTATPVPPSP